MILLGGQLALPTMDQELYIRLAGSLLAGRGLSFGSDVGMMKTVNTGEDEVASSWATDPEYVFGLARTDSPTATIEPGYPVLLALFFAVFGTASGSVFLLNLLAQIAGAWAVFLLGERYGGRRTGLMAALFFAVHPYFVFYTASAMTESLHIALVPWVALATARALDERKGGFAAGAAAGLLFLVRSTVLVLLPVQIALLLFRRMFRQALLLLAGFAVLASPWVVRNAVEMGQPLLLPTKGSLNLWMRNNPEALAMEGIDIPQSVLQTVQRRDLLEYPDPGSFRTETERSGELSRRATAFLLANPRLVLWLSFQRLASFMSPLPQSGTGGLKALLTGFLVYVPLLALAVAGFARWRRETGAVVAAAFFLAYLLAHAMAHGGMRYRLPVETMLIFLAASAFRRRAPVRDEP
jgi:4-amino-4-deoxy-L-arabinose transferase-like glycosyltransferase